MEIFHDLAIRCRRITWVRLFRTLALQLQTKIHGELGAKYKYKTKKCKYEL